MPVSILMPSLSPTMEEGILAKWLVKEGDMIRPGTMLCSVETDKATVDYESLDEGYLRTILVPAGSLTKVNQLIAILSETKEEDIGEFTQKALDKNQKVATLSKTPPTATTSSASPSTQSPVNLSIPVLPLTTTSPEKSTSDRIKISPLAKKMALESGIPYKAIQGSGPQGRIIRRDVEGYKPSSQSMPKPTEETQRPLFGSQLPPAISQDIPLTMMRKTIARRLLESSQTIPVFAVTLKVDLEPLTTFRSQLKRGPGYKVSVNDMILKASAFALRRHPAVNSSWMGDSVRLHGNIDIGVAVSLDGGVITPIIKNADQKPLWEISEEIKALAAKARIGKLAPEEYLGGTFTVSNLGMYGVDEFTAIISPPQAAILSVGGSQSEVFLNVYGIPEQRQVMKITLNSDHRLIDGALAAQFLGTLKSALENPIWLMI